MRRPIDLQLTISLVKGMKEVVPAGFCMVITLIMLIPFSYSSTPQNGVVSIAFDDGLRSAYVNAWPVMKARGIVGTFYVISDKIGGSYMTVAELLNLQANGCEIASHSKTHPSFTYMSDSRIFQECTVSKQVLQSYGLIINNFAYPYGDGNDHTDSIVSQYYRSGRSAYDRPYIMRLPTSQFRLLATAGNAQTSFLELKNYVDSVIASKGWAIILFHDVVPRVTGSWQTATQVFSDFLNYLVSKSVAVLTVNQALNIASQPLTPSLFSAGFEDGKASGWSWPVATPTVVNDVRYSGTYSCKFPSSICYLAKAGLAHNTLYTSVYARISNLPSSDRFVTVLRGQTASGQLIYRLFFSNRWGALTVSLTTYAPTWARIDYRLSYNVNTWYCFKVKYAVNSEVRFWVNDVEAGARTGISGIGQQDRVLVGQVESNYATSVWIDSVSVYTDADNDRIGLSFDTVDPSFNNEDRYPLTYPYGYELGGVSPDLNKDGIVNIVDVTKVASAFGSVPGDSNWDAVADMDLNEVINVVDLSKVAKQFGKTV